MAKTPDSTPTSSRRTRVTNVVDLAQARDRLRRARPVIDTEYEHAMRIGRQMADAINSGRVNLGRSPSLGTIEQEEALVRRMQVMVARLKRREGRA